MTPMLRKFVLTTHITLSVGWIGAVCAYLVLVIAAMVGQDTQTLTAAWIAMRLIGLYILIPFALASLLTGLVMSLGTPWGLFRHYWILSSLALTFVATIVLLQHMKTVTFFAHVAAGPGVVDVAGLRHALNGELLHAGVGLLVLLSIEAINVFKPQGMTEYGRRKLSQAAQNSRIADYPRATPDRQPAGKTPRWLQIAGYHAAAAAVLLAILHITGGGIQHH